jgi:hypothetical protein
VPRTLLKIFVEHLFPTRRVDAGGIRYHAVEIKEDGVVLIAADALAIRLPHEPLSCYQRTTALATIQSRRNPFQIRTAGISRQ